MLTDSEDTEEIIERVAALDIGKAELVACIRVPNPDKPGRQAQEITTYSTMTRSLLGLAERLRALIVYRVMMDATSTTRSTATRPGGPRPTFATPAPGPAAALKPVAVPSVEQEAARDLVRAREDVRSDLMSARHRLSKLLLRQGIVYYGGKPWNGAHDRWLRSQRFDLPNLQLAYEVAHDTM